MRATSIVFVLHALVVSACAAPVNPSEGVGDGEDAVLDLDAGGKADGALALGSSRPSHTFRIGCDPDRGCSRHVILTVQSVGAVPARVRVLVGRYDDSLVHAGTIDADGEDVVSLAVPLSVPAISEEPVGTAQRHDPFEHALVVFELEEPQRSAAAIEIDSCLHDAIEHELGDIQMFDDEESRRGRFLQDTSDVHTLHSGRDWDRFEFDVVDDPSVGLLPQGRIVEVRVYPVTGTLRTGHIQAAYTCWSDGAETLLERDIEQSGFLQLGLNPDCTGTDDSGRVSIVVADRTASPFSCPHYQVTAIIRNSAL